LAEELPYKLKGNRLEKDQAQLTTDKEVSLISGMLDHRTTSKSTTNSILKKWYI